ncbi:cadherin repeat domain-containing protein [Candidatus Poribacteria bacterium]|nr:cadherin repeat domain-containing protein [Candidatus Poribacteria bacterium]
MEAERISDNSDLIDELTDGEAETITLPETETVPQDDGVGGQTPPNNNGANNNGGIDDNTAPEFTEGDNTSRDVYENRAMGEYIGAPISASDNENDNLTYVLHGTDQVSFSIDQSTGQLMVNTDLDYETKDMYSVIITVSDDSLSDSIDVTIYVLDIDETPPEIINGGSGNNGNNGNGNNGNNGDENGGGNGGGNGDDDTTTTTTTTTPTSIPVGETDISSHYYYDSLDPISGDGWLVQIYYPANYNGPRKLREDPAGYGFAVTLSDGFIKDFAQTAVDCWDYNDDGIYDKPCNETDNATYSVQIYVKTGEPIITITVTWQPPYSGRTATYTLDRSINLAKYDDPKYHEDHTSQQR